MSKTPIIAIIGKPNAGKSTLFNRLIGKNIAITSDIAGTTRDRLYQEFDCNGYKTLLIDTGGLSDGPKENIEKEVQTQAKLAISEADIIIFAIDSSEELTKDDFSVAEMIRRTDKKVILVANKYDSKKAEENFYNIYELGIDDPIQISAIHDKGMDKLKEKIEKNLKQLKFKKTKHSKEEKNDSIRICIIGKPNAGKSSLFNSLTGSNQVIISDIPGTTRDTIDTDITYKDKKYTLIDTAGLRQKGKIGKGIEYFSSLRCISAIERSETAILIIDGTEKRISHQDTSIVQYVLESNKGLILAINKNDRLNTEDKNLIIKYLRYKFPFLPWAPVVFISAKNKNNTYKILELAEEINRERSKTIKTPALNNLLQKITIKHLPSSAKAQKPKFFYASQTGTNPPKFTFFFRHAKNLHFSYPRYIENELRKEFGFNGTPLILKFKGKGEDK